MNHIALYRSWRPQTFQDVVGQKHIVQTLQNSLKEGRISHAYLFSGPRGTGKTSAAKIMAKAVNCNQGAVEEPCNECSACIRITEGSIMDVFEIDAASNRGVEEIRDIRDKVKYAPSEVRYKVYIIDEVHMLTTEAFNALLKTLEEPPAHVIFILATTEPNRIPATIISRCQRFDFRRVSLEDQMGRLEFICQQEGISADSDALQYIARLSDGGMRDALSLLDQIVSFSGNAITYSHVIAVTGGIDTEQFKQLAIAMKEQDIGGALERVEGLVSEGKSVDKCMESLIQYFRDLLIIKLLPNLHDMTERILDPSHFSELAHEYENEQIFQIIDILNHYHTEMKYASQPQTLFEIAVMKICSLPVKQVLLDQSKDWQQLLSKVEQLERQLTELKQSGMAGTLPSKRPPAIQSSASANEIDDHSSQQSASRSTAPIQQEQPQPQQSLSLDRLKSASRLEPFLQGREGPAFKEACAKWSQILSQVREEKITVHAWLVDGEPVSVTDKAILVAFKNEIHRKTTEKPSNKQIIEKVIHEVLGKPLVIETLMQKDWKDILSPESDSSPHQAAEEEFQLVPENRQQGKHKEEWINEAIELFGEDLITIKED